MNFCKICQRRFRTRKGLLIHISKKHKKKIQSSKIILFSLLDYLLDFDLLNLTEIFLHETEYWYKRLTSIYNLSRPLPESKSFIYLFKKIIGTECYHCDTKTIRKNLFYKFPLCFSCQKKYPYYKCITESLAIKEFSLTTLDLKELECLEVPNPFSSSFPLIRLYLKFDVDLVFKSKEANKRRTKLSVKLMELGLTLESDNILCNNFIVGFKEFSIKEIIEEIALMKYLEEYTDFSKRVNDKVEGIKSECGYYPEGVWRETSSLIKKDYTRPTIWPWL